MKMTNGYILGLIKDPNLNPFYLFRDTKDKVIYNISTLEMPGRLYDEYYPNLLSIFIQSYAEFNDVLLSLVDHNVKDTYIVVDKFDMVVYMLYQSLFNKEIKPYRPNEYTNTFGKLLTLDNKIILVNKPYKIEPVDKFDYKINFNMSKIMGIYCNDVAYLRNRTPKTLITHYYDDSKAIDIVEPTIQHIEESFIGL